MNSAGGDGGRGARGGGGDSDRGARGGGGDSDRGDPEAVLSQALRAMAGGHSSVAGASGARPTPGVGDGRSRGTAPGRPPLTAVQILLMAAIIGVLIGMAAGFTVLLVR